MPRPEPTDLLSRTYSRKTLKQHEGLFDAIPPTSNVYQSAQEFRESLGYLNLSEEEITLLTLRFVDEMTFKDIADYFSLGSASTAYMRYKRLTKRIKSAKA